MPASPQSERRINWPVIPFRFDRMSFAPRKPNSQKPAKSSVAAEVPQVKGGAVLLIYIRQRSARGFSHASHGPKRTSKQGCKPEGLDFAWMSLVGKQDPPSKASRSLRARLRSRPACGRCQTPPAVHAPALAASPPQRARLAQRANKSSPFGPLDPTTSPGLERAWAGGGGPRAFCSRLRGASFGRGASRYTLESDL